MSKAVIEVVELPGGEVEITVDTSLASRKVLDTVELIRAVMEQMKLMRG